MKYQVEEEQQEEKKSLFFFLKIINSNKNSKLERILYLRKERNFPIVCPPLQPFLQEQQPPNKHTFLKVVARYQSNPNKLNKRKCHVVARYTPERGVRGQSLSKRPTKCFRSGQQGVPTWKQGTRLSCLKRRLKQCRV